MVRRPVALTVLAAMVCTSLGAAVADADRRATESERKAVANAVDLPPKCSTVRISTETRRPKWATAQWKPGGASCEPLAADGVVVLKRRDGRWRFVTAGSDFECGSLYREVPRKVALDLDLDDWCR